MANDFRAQQVRLNRLIGSGSTILVYPSSSASDLAGNFTFSTGSVGTDVFLFVSGSATAKTLFGGGVHVSGAITVGGATTLNGTVGLGDAAADVVTVTGQLTASQGLSASLPVIGGTARFNFISGTLRKTSGGSDFIVGSGVTVNYNSSGQWEFTGSSGLPAGTNGGVLVYAGGSWASSLAGTARQVLTSNGAASASWGQFVLPLGIGSSITTALPADSALGFQWAVRSIVVRDFLDSNWIDVWRVDGAAYWQFGTDNTSYSSGTMLLGPTTGELLLRRGAVNHVKVATDGTLTLGSVSYPTAVVGSTLTIGDTSVVSVYQGGARVPERTLTTDTSLTAQDEVVFVSTVSGQVVLTLPAGTAGRVLTVQRITGSNNLVLSRSGTDTIWQGSSGSQVLWTISDDFRHSLIFRSGGSEWVAES